MTIDPVTFQVIQQRLSGIVQQMQDNIFRTGYSTIVRESQDASCMILDRDGSVVGEHVILPLHIAALPDVVRAVLRTYPNAIRPGDAFITNHPYLAGVTHSMDMAVAVPVFYQGELIAFCANIAHKSDLGGIVPGTAYGNAREIFQEGIQYPPVKLLDQGRTVYEVEAILRANSRTPDLILGDIRGQVGTAHLGEERLFETIDRYGLAALKETFAGVQNYTETRMRQAIAQWNDGIFEGEEEVDNDGIELDSPVFYRVRIEKRGERILFDFSGSSDQTKGPININPSLVRGCCYYAMVAMVDPTLSNNGGVARVVETRFRPGSVVHPEFPAPTNTYMTAATAVTEALFKAMIGLAPGRRMAGTGGGGGVTFGGRRLDGTPFVSYETIGSAYGGRTGKDGVSGVSVLLSNTLTAPVEILETEFPLRINRFELRTDSGGAGQYRGGLGMVREYQMLAQEAQLTLRGGKHREPAFGEDGGMPGALGALIVFPGTPRERRMPSRFSGVQLTTGDVVRLEKAGGGGLGPPAARSHEAVIQDVLNGYVSKDAALSIYGIDPKALELALLEWDGPEGGR